MAYQKVNLERKYHPYKEMKPQQVIAEGNYLGQGQDQFQNPTYEFRNPDNDYIDVLNKCGHLRWLVDTYVKEGDWCRVTYAGVQKAKKGPYKDKDQHTLDLDIDPERAVKVASPAPTEEQEHFRVDGDDFETV